VKSCEVGSIFLVCLQRRTRGDRQCHRDHRQRNRRTVHIAFGAFALNCADAMQHKKDSENADWPVCGDTIGQSGQMNHLPDCALIVQVEAGPPKLLTTPFPDSFRVTDNPDVVAHGYFGTVDGNSGDGILRPASVYSPKKRIVAIASKETGTHMPFSCPNCIVR
jgi:hypothetical protein